MESQFVNTKVVSVVYQESAVNAPVGDGVLAVLGGFYQDPVYSAAYGTSFADINTRIATLPTSATQAGVGIINLATVGTANGMDNTVYKMGIETIGLTVEAGKPVRFRKFAMDDTFFIGSENFVAAPVVGQFAIVDPTGKFLASATKPATGLVAQVVSTSTVSRGVSADVTQYFMLIVQEQ
jgi:hypothetical protein